MKTPAIGLGLIISGVLASTAHAAIDGSTPVICAVAEVTECLPEESCQRVKAIDANLPRFLRIDFKGKEITRIDPTGDDITSKIERRESVDGRLVLLGPDGEDELAAIELRDATGASAAVSSAGCTIEILNSRLSFLH